MGAGERFSIPMKPEQAALYEKLEAMLCLGPPNGAETRELQEIDGNGGWGTYKNDGKRYADFLAPR